MEDVTFYIEERKDFKLFPGKVFPYQFICVDIVQKFTKKEIKENPLLPNELVYKFEVPFGLN